MKNTIIALLKRLCLKSGIKQSLIFVFSIALVNIAYANPELNSVTSGNVSISQTTNTTVINQSSQKAIIEWNKFNIHANEKTQFVQPNASATALNRINSANGASQILGSLTANGKIILINQSGFYFGPNAHVDVGGIIASTADISNANFLAGNYLFTNGGTGAIINEGSIKASDYGLIALIGNSIANSGLIQAKLGSIVLASGSAFTLDFYGDQLINFAVTENADVSGKVENTGTLLADGGKILVSAKTAQGVLDNAINMQGLVQAKSVAESNGEIILSSDKSITVAGTFDASGEQGGLIKILGKYIHLASNTVLNVNGDNGGGTILVGGNAYGAGPEANALQTVVDAGAILSANANYHGNGGKVIVWSDNATLFHGTISVLGGSLSGNGGFTETSGHYLNIANSHVYLSAPHGVGGTWLLDPADVTITMGTSNDTLTNGTYEPTSGSSTSYVDYLSLQTALASGNITVTTTNSGTDGGGLGDIQVSHTLTWASPFTLTLNAARNIYINSNITAPSGGLNLIAVNGAQSLTSGTIGSGSIGGAVGTLTASIIVNNFTLTQGQWFQNATTLPTFTVYNNFQISSSSPVYNATYNAQFTRINTTSGNGITDVFGLQGIATGPLTENYNLRNNIDASSTRQWGTTGFTPIGNFNGNTVYAGTFEGNNYIIDKLFLNPSTGYIGLFGIANGITVQNLGLTNVDISTFIGTSNTGAVVGQMGNGTIDNVFVTGNIRALQAVGGIVGVISGAGTISNSYNAANIIAASPDAIWVGGIAGMVFNGATIINTYNVGSITSYGNTSGNSVGGIVGSFNASVFNGGTNTIINTYNSGLITATTGDIGGLVGAIGGGATIQNSFWDTTTSGISSSTQGCGNVGSCSGATGVSTADMMTASTFSSWGSDLATASSATPNDAVWFMIPNNTRPMLISEAFSSNTPKPIYTGHQLQLMSANLSGTYTLGYHIDLESSITNPSDVWGTNNAGSGYGFYPVGNNSAAFSGTLNGQDYAINHLYINRPNTDYIGLFGKVSNNITNVGVINASVTGFDNVGILIGNLVSGTISDTYTTGTVTGTNDNAPNYGTGGLIGSADGGTVTTSYSAANVFAPVYLGGLIGQINNTTVSYSYSIGDVTSKYPNYVGGFIGAVGLTGSSNIIKSYSTGLVSARGTNTVGGFVGGTNLATITGSFWDTATSGLTVGNGDGSSSGITGGIFDGTNSGSLATSGTYTSAGWSSSSGVAGSITSFGNFSATPPNYTWFIINGYTRPILLMEYNAQISNAHQVQLMAAASNGSYTLSNNIDLNPGMTNAADIWGTNKNLAIGRGFNPLDNFQGSLNGNNHTIDGLYIKRIAGESYNGLFGRLYGSLVNIGLINAELNASQTSGVLVGNLIGSIANSYATGTAYFTGGSNGGLVGSLSSNSTVYNSYANVSITTPSSNTSSYVGGLAGISFGTIGYSYSLGDVSLVNGSNVGGFIGYNGFATTNAYSTGLVTSSGISGGFAGYVGGNITNSFWDASTSGKTNGYGTFSSGTVSLYGGCFGSCALTISNATNTSPVDLSAASTYSGHGWDISSTVSSSKPTSTWFIFDGATRPLLMMEYSTSITNAHQLQLMGTAINNGYTLANDIDLDDSFTNASDIWGTNYSTNTGAGFNPIANNGTPFTGTFEGNSHILNNLYINTTQTTAGLFGSLSHSNIFNLSITNANITYIGTTDANVGILAGETYNVGNFTRIFTSGTLNSGTATNNNLGGLFGYMNQANLSNSYNAATINSTGTDNGYSNNVGGIAGTVTNGSYITNSYNIGTVNGSSFAGDKVGGLIGSYTAGGNSIITNTYNSGLTSFGSTRGGLVGFSDGGTTNVILNSFWDTETSGNNSGVGFGNEGTGGSMTGGTFNGHSGANLSSLATFSGASWGIIASSNTLPNNNTWFIIEGNTRPVLLSELFYNNTALPIHTSHQLQLMNAALNGRYILGGDVDLSSVYNTSTAAATAFSKADIWGGSATGAGLGFVPIGNSSTQFTGAFDGQHYTASNLYINRSTENIGLFGYVNSLNAIKNIGVTDANVTGTYNVGALIGYATGDAFISHTYSTGATNGTVIQSFSGVGGLVGRIDGAIINYSFSLANVTGAGDAGGLIGDLTNDNSGIYHSFSGGNVIGTQNTGGLAGLNDNFSQIYNSYSFSKVTSTGVAGGLVGNNTDAYVTNSFSTGLIHGDTFEGGLIGLYSSGTITNSFWNTLTTGQSTSGGSSGSAGYQGMTTSDMMTLSNFQAGSSFISGNAWNIVAASTGNESAFAMIDGSSYPYLTAFYAAVPRVVSGTTNANAGSTVNLATNGSLISGSAGSDGNAVSYGTTSVGSNNFYYFLESAGAITDGNSILAYLTGGSVGNAITSAPTSTASITGLTLTTNQISVGDSNTSSVSNTSLIAAAANINPSDILYSGTGSNLTINNNINFVVANNSTTYTIDGSLTATGTSTLSFAGPVIINNGGSAITSAANQTYNDTITLTSDATFTNSNSLASISLAAIGGSGHSLTINTAGTATISGIFTGTNNNLVLNANNSTGTLILTGANDYTGTTTITAGVLRIGDGGTTGALGSGTVTNNASLIFNLSNGTINADGSISSSSVFASDITGTGTITQAGSGVIELNGNSNFSGGTTINAGGSLVMDNGNALGTGNISVADGATLMLAPDATIANTITLAGTMLPYQNAAGTTLEGLLTISGANAVIGSATENVNTTNFNIGNLAQTSGGLAGSGTLTSYFIIPSGTFHIYGIDNASTFTGTLRLTAGTNIAAHSINNLGTSAATVEFADATAFLNVGVSQVANLVASFSGTLQLVTEAIWAGSINLVGASTTLIVQNAITVGNATISGAISGAGNLQFTDNGGSGTVVFTNANNTYSGTTDLNGYTLQQGIANATSPNSLILFNNGTLDLNGYDDNINGVAGLSGNGTISLGAKTLLTNDANNNTFSGTITGTGGSLTKSGVGTFTLSGSNTYTGTTTISNGTLQAGASNVFDSTSSLSITSGAIFDLNNYATSIGSLTGSGNITLGTETLTIGGNNTNTTYSGVISGAGSGTTGAITKVGTGNLTFAVDNTYTGDTNINVGTLTLGSANAIPAASTINMGVSGILGIGINKTVGGLTGSGNINIDTGFTLTVNNGTNNSYSGALTGGGSLTKQGAGTLTLSGNNSYTGITSIQSGILEFSNNATLGNISVASGSSLQISGVTITTPQISLSGSGVGGASAALLGSGTAVLSGTISLAADSILGTLLTADSLTVSGVINGAHALSLATGAITLSGAIGATTPLTSLTSNAATTFLNGGTVNTSGNQTYNAALSANTALTFTAANVYLNGGSVTTGGTQTYNAPIILGANTSLSTSNNLNVNNGVSGAYTLSLLGSTSSNKTYTLSGTLAVNSISITGGSGSANTLSVQTNTPQTWNISSTNAGSISGAGSNINFASIHAIVGDSTQSNTLSSSISTNTWNISGTNAGSVTGLTSYTNMQNLTGSSGSNTYIIGNNGSVTGTLNGGSGITGNTLNFASYSSPVNFTVTADNSGTVPGRIATFSNIGSVVGNGSGTLSVSMLNQKINITNTGGYVADPINFTNFVSFNGGSTTRIVFLTPATIISQNGSTFTASVNGVTYTFVSAAGYSGSVTSPTLYTPQASAVINSVVTSATTTATGTSIVPSTAQQPTQIFSGSAAEASLQQSMTLGTFVSNNVTTISTAQQTEDVDTSNAQQISTNCS